MLVKLKIYLANAMARAQLQDGLNMLAGFLQQVNLQKYSIEIVEMTPNTQTPWNLKELNELIAEQKGNPSRFCSSKSAEVAPKTAPTTTNIVEDATQQVNHIDEQLAAQYCPS